MLLAKEHCPLKIGADRGRDDYENRHNCKVLEIGNVKGFSKYTCFTIFIVIKINV
jgi:hypothetical protein